MSSADCKSKYRKVVLTDMIFLFIEVAVIVCSIPVLIYYVEEPVLIYIVFIYGFVSMFMGIQLYHIKIFVDKLHDS